MADGSPGPKTVTPAFQHTVMFWVLASVAGVLFVPCALLPVYAEYATWREHRARLQARVEALQARSRRNETIIDALRTDPAVNARLLARDLGYVSPGQEVVTVLPPPRAEWQGRLQAVLSEDPSRKSDPERQPAAALQSWEENIEQRLPPGDLMAVFIDPSSRRVLLIMSGVLLAVALVIFPNQRGRA
jgi:hypothetical protein